MTCAKHRAHACVICRHTMTPHHDVHACRIAAAHFQSIDAREDLLNREICGDRRAARTGAGQAVDRGRSAQAIHANRPHGITQHSEQTKSVLKRRCTKRARCFECVLCSRDATLHLIERGPESGDKLAVACHEPHACVAAQ